MLENRQRILHWTEAGLLDETSLAQAIEITNSQPNQRQWLEFIQLGLLWLAVGSFSCGVIFFFAYNWQEIPRLAKFALVELAICLSAIIYVRHWGSKIITTGLLMSMSVLTGALLALVGQTFQTGADPWQLFALWALFMLPWSLIGHSSILWIFNILLSNLALFLYLDVNQNLLWVLWSAESVFWLVFAFNSALLTLFELQRFYQRKVQQHTQSEPGNSNRYSQQVLAVIALWSISFVAVKSFWAGTFNLEFLGCILALIAVLLVYRYFIRDLFILTLGCLSFIFVSSAFILSHSNYDEAGQFLLTGLNIVVCSALAGKWLKSLSLLFKHASATDNHTDDARPIEWEEDQ